ncbi:MAG: type II toxin-antitoxin system RelE/ParE family toxin [Planctomycetota bacterium]|nr:type II toxin-antitoxin system RelE/ParE family toxin [Planctomycetota bacterium]
MTRRIIRRDRARDDLVDHFAYLAERSLNAADHFFEEVEGTLRELADHPYAGGSYRTGNVRLSRLRCSRVSRRFSKYLIFYLPLEDGIDVVRVLHGAQSVDTILKSE